MSAEKMNWKKRLGIVCGSLFILYTVFGFIGMPLLLRYVGLRMVNKELAGVVEVGAIRVNPFSYSLLLRDIAMRTEDGGQVFSATRFYGNFAFWSLFGKGWRFQEVHLAQPKITVAVDRDGRLNLQQMLKPPTAEQGPEAEREPIVIPLIRVDRLWVEQGGFDLSLVLPGGEYARQGRDINLELTDFSSNPQMTNPYSFVAKTEQGEFVQVEGRLRLNPLSTRGTVSLADAQLGGLEVFAADTIGIRIDSGSLSLRFDYLFSPVSEPRGLFVEQGQLAVRDVALASSDGAETFARLGLFEAAGFKVDLLNHNVQLESMRLEGSRLRVARDKEGLLNLIRYLFPEHRQREIAELVQTELVGRQQRMEMIRLGVVSDDQDIGVALTSAWHQVQELLDLGLRFSVGELTAANNTLELHDAFPRVPVHFALNDIAFKASDVRNYGAEPFPFEVSLHTRGSVGERGEGSAEAILSNALSAGNQAVTDRESSADREATTDRETITGSESIAKSGVDAGGLNGSESDHGSVSGRGDFTPESDSANFAYSVANFDLATFAPYLDSLTTAQLVSAFAFSSGEGSISFPAEALPQVRLDFEAQLKDLRVDDPADGLSVLAVKSINLETAHATSDPIAFHADLLHIVNPALRVVRDAQQQINLLALVPLLVQQLGLQGEVQEVPATAEAEGLAAQSAEAPSAALSKEVGARAQVAEKAPALTGDAGTTTAPKAESAKVATTPGGEDAPLDAAQWQALMMASAADAVSQSQVAVAIKGVDLGNLSLGVLRISGGSVTIEDAAVVPPASFRLSDAELNVGPIVLQADNVTRFSASGRLTDGASGLIGSVSGEFLTLDPLQSTRAEVSLKDFSLASFGGYSEPMVGRALDEGTLTRADFRYTIAESKLQGDNRVTMKNVGFAPRRDESTGPRLPLDLGIAILSDRSGSMRLDVPVSGDLTDPSFDLSQVIQYALINVFERLVTAPFAVLGSLLGGGEDGTGPARSVVFDPGSAVLPENQLEGLQLLADVLYERPTLGLQMRPVLTDAADLSALRERLLEERLQAYAQQYDLDEARAIQRLYDQLLSALPAMHPQARAGIEAMIAQAAARATLPDSESETLTLAAPPPMVEGGDAALETVILRSTSRARRGRGFLAVSEELQVLVPATATSPAPDASADGEPAATEATQTAGTDASSSAETMAEPSLADKRTLLLSQTMVTQSALQTLAAGRVDAISKALESMEPHPLAANRIRVGEPWQPQAQVPEQQVIPGVYFELEALKGATVDSDADAAAEVSTDVGAGAEASTDAGASAEASTDAGASAEASTDAGASAEAGTDAGAAAEAVSSTPALPAGAAADFTSVGGGS